MSSGHKDPIGDLLGALRIASAASQSSGVTANFKRIDAAYAAIQKVETLLEAARGVVGNTGAISDLRAAVEAFA